jgi:hypothetical protein
VPRAFLAAKLGIRLVERDVLAPARLALFAPALLDRTLPVVLFARALFLRRRLALGRFFWIDALRFTVRTNCDVLPATRPKVAPIAFATSVSNFSSVMLAS